MFDASLNANKSTAPTPSEALELMRKDVAAHHEQDSQKSYLATGISAVTGLFRADSLGAVEKLQQDLQSATTRGDNETAQRLAAQANDLVKADQSSMRLDQQINMYGSGMIKTAGMFMPGRAGWAIAAATGVMDQAKPSESFSNQIIDGGLGLTKGLALKGTFNKVGGADMGIAAKALSLGVGSRVIDSSLTRETYQTADGGYSVMTGLSRIGDQSFNKRALASDLITFGVAHGAVSGIDRITGGALKNSPFMSTIATGGIFGVSAGSVNEINRQQQAGEKFDISKVLTSAALTGVTDLVASAPGARMMSARSIEAKAPENVPPRSGLDTGTKYSKAAETDNTLVPIKSEQSATFSRTIDGGASKQFQLVDSNLGELIARLRTNPSEPVMAKVRGIIDGKMGPTQHMLIEHNSDATRVPTAVESKMFNYADIIATCNPKTLPEAAQAKHIMPLADDVYLTANTSGILKFTPVKPIENRLGDFEPIKLGGQTVSELLTGKSIPDYLHDTHNRIAMAKALSDFKVPVRFVRGGADSIVFDLPDHNVLKITDHGWDPSWGSREIQTAHGSRLIDAPMIQRPKTVDLEDETITWFVQKRLRTPVTADQVRLFDNELNMDGKYKFWDNDFKEHGQGQLGEDPKSHQVYLLDYDAVRLPGLVPKDQVNGESWWASRYFRSRSDSDRSRRSRHDW